MTSHLPSKPVIMVNDYHVLPRPTSKEKADKKKGNLKGLGRNVGALCLPAFLDLRLKCWCGDALELLLSYSSQATRH